MGEKKRILRNMILSVAGILAAFGILIGGFYGYNAYQDREAKKKRIVYLNADGAFGFDSPGNRVTPSELEKIIASYAESAGKEDNSIFSNFKMYIQADPESRMWQFNETQKLCYMYYTRLYLSEKYSDEWREIKLNELVDIGDYKLPRPYGNTEDNERLYRGLFFGLNLFYGVIDDSHFVIKLQWFGKNKNERSEIRKYDETIDDYMANEKDGRVIFKIGADVFHDENGNFKIDDFIKYLKEAKSDYRPPREHPDKTIPMIIRADEPVQMKHVFRLIRILQTLEITDFYFGAPEKPY